MLEVSNIAKEIMGDNGLLVYQIGTRTANTTLQLKDGETQILAGLIKKENISSERTVPGLGSIPGISRLFSNENESRKKTELVLLITPRIVRNTSYRDSFESEFYSGTKDRFSLTLPSLGEQASYAKELKKPSAESVSLSVQAVAPKGLGSKVFGAIDRAQFSLVTPQSVSSGQEFNVPIALDSKYLQSAEFSLSSNSKNIEIVSVESMLPEQALVYSVKPQVASFSLSKSRVPRGGDVLAVVRMRALSVETNENSVLEVKPELSIGTTQSNILAGSQTISVLAGSQDPANTLPGMVLPDGNVP
jgi:general secretion pathway protein D